MSNHTRGPWCLLKDTSRGQSLAVFSGTRKVATTYAAGRSIRVEEGNANAERIIACVNAFEPEGEVRKALTEALSFIAANYSRVTSGDIDDHDAREVHILLDAALALLDGEDGGS